MSKTIIDLSIVKFAICQFNFSSFTVEQLKAWIFQDINQTFEFYKISLDYPDDYGVKSLDDATLKQFLTSEKLGSINNYDLCSRWIIKSH